LRIELLQQYVGKVITLDLVSGVQLVTKLKSLDAANRELVVGQLRLFQIQVVQRTPNGPPEGVVQNFPYGQPLYQLGDEHRIQADHVILVMVPNAEMAAVYTKETSGILPANAAALDALKGVDFNKIGG
jgi:hypothetical protein